MPGGTWGRTVNLIKSGVAAVLVVAVIATPFMIVDARSESNPDGALRWFKRSYVGTIGCPTLSTHHYVGLQPVAS